MEAKTRCSNDWRKEIAKGNVTLSACWKTLVVEVFKGNQSEPIRRREKRAGMGGEEEEEEDEPG